MQPESDVTVVGLLVAAFVSCQLYQQFSLGQGQNIFSTSAQACTSLCFSTVSAKAQQIFLAKPLLVCRKQAVCAAVHLQRHFALTAAMVTSCAQLPGVDVPSQTADWEP